MSDRDYDLDRITTLLGQCLGRIDEQAFRLQNDEQELDEQGSADVLEQEAAALQELVGSLIDQHVDKEQADLNRIVEHSLRDCLAELGMPVVVRQRLTTGLPPIACRAGQLAYAVQRAVMLTLSRVDRGGDILVTTRRDGNYAVFELECNGGGRDRHLQERATTLCEFVAGFQGLCRVDEDERGTLLIALELPTALVVDDY